MTFYQLRNHRPGLLFFLILIPVIIPLAALSFFDPDPIGHDLIRLGFVTVCVGALVVWFSTWDILLDWDYIGPVKWKKTRVRKQGVIYRMIKLAVDKGDLVKEPYQRWIMSRSYHLIDYQDFLRLGKPKFLTSEEIKKVSVREGELPDYD